MYSFKLVSAINGTVTAVLDKEVDAVTAADFTLTQSVNGGVAATVTPTAVSLGSDKKTVTITVPGVTKTTVEQSVVFTAAYKGSEAKSAAAFTVEAAIKDLAVEKIEAINLNQVKVVFTKAVSKTTAENEANYLLNNSARTSANALAELQADEKTVILTLSEANFTQGKKAVVKVQGIEEKGSLAPVPAKTEEVTFFDVTVPQVTSVTSVGNKTIRVTFDEAVTNAGNINGSITTAADQYLLNGLPLSSFGFITSTTASQENPSYVARPTNSNGIYGTAVDLTFSTALPAGNYTLTVNSNSINPTDAIKDAAGFIVEKVEKTFTVTADTNAPKIVSTSALTNGQVDVVFDKEMNKSSVEAANSTNKYILNGTNASSATLQSDKKTVRLSFVAGTVVEGPNVLVVDNILEDVYGNKLHATDDLRVAVTGTKDTTAPSLQGVIMTDDKNIKLTYSEPVNTAAAENTANYALKNAAGVDVSSTYITGATITKRSGSEAHIVDIQLAANLPAGTYTLTAKNISDLAGNKLINQSLSVSPVDKTKPQYSAGNAILYTTGKKVEIKFSEPMQVTGENSILNAANYTYSNGGDSAHEEFPAGTTIVAGADNKSAIITFPSTLTTLDAADYIRVFNVKDTAGNLLDGISVSRQLTAAASAATVGVVDKSYNATYADGKVYVEFQTKEQLTTLNATNFKIASDASTSIGSVTLATATTGTINGKTVKLVFENNVNDILAAGNGIYLDIPASSGATNAGVPLETKQTSRYQIKDLIAPVVAGEPVLATSTTVEVTFNENIDAGLATTYKDDFEVIVNGATATVTTAAVSGKTLTLTLKDAVTGTVVLKPVDANISITDTTGNKYVPTTAQKTSGLDTVAPTTTLSKAVYTVTTTDTLVLTASSSLLTQLNVASGTDVKDLVDWSKIVINAATDADVTSTVKISKADVASAVATNATTLTISFTAGKKTSNAAAMGTVVTNDGVTVTAGFLKDLAGNSASTDALTDANLGD